MMKNLYSAILLLVIGLSAPNEALAWTIEIDFEGGAVGQPCSGARALSGAFALSIYSTKEVYGGSRSCQFGIEERSEGWNQWGGVVNFPTHLKKGEELWLRIRTFFPNNFSLEANPHLKFLRVHTRSDSELNHGYDDWYLNNNGTHKWIYEGAPEWVRAGTSSDAVVKGVWETYEIYHRFDDIPTDNGGLGRVRMWKNGALLADATHVSTLKKPDSYARLSYIFTYWNGTAPQTQHMYVDDIVFTTDRPSSTDPEGNPMIGMGSPQTQPSAPQPPVLLPGE